MTIRVFLSAAICIGIISCTNSTRQADPKKQTPAALDDERSYDYSSKRSGNDNLVDRLYNELVEKDPALQRLEDNIQHLYSSSADSTEKINDFKAKMEKYYKYANGEVASIKDSVLRERIKILVTRNMDRYNSRVEKNNELLKVMENKELTVADLHTALKISRTLSVIEQYQKQHLPSTKPLEGYIKQQDKTLRLLDTLFEKH